MAVFGHSAQKREQQSTTVYESAYLRFGEGERIVRILDRSKTEFWRYWMDVNVNGKREGRSITIASKRESPIARYFDAIGFGNPGFRGINRRLLLNVLDRTPVKKTAQGLTVYADAKGVYPSTHSYENISASPIVQNNKVYIMEFGPQLLDNLLMLHERIRSQRTYEPLPLWQFDVKIISKGKGIDTTRVAFPDDQTPLSEELLALPKYDLTQVAKPMPVEYQQKLLDGADYNEVMKELGWERPVATVPQDNEDLF